MRIHIASDHAGYELKEHVAEHLRAAGHDLVDHGAASFDPQDDYPPMCIAAASAAVADPGSLAVVIGGSGNGEAIAANKVPGIRCALLFSEETARLARQHNDAQVGSLGGRMYPVQDAVAWATVFVETPFSEDPRHVRRIAMIADYERTGLVPEPS